MPINAAQTFLNYKHSIKNIEVFMDDITKANKPASVIDVKREIE